MKDLTILCSSVGNDGFPAVAEALRSNDEGRAVRIVGTDIRENAPGLYLADEGTVVTRRSAPGHLEEMVELARRIGADAFLPLSTEDQLFYARARDRFGAPVITSRVESLEIAVDKFRLASFLLEEGLQVRVPRFERVPDSSDLERLARSFGYPQRKVVFKLDRGCGAQGLRILDSEVSASRRLVDRNNRDVTLEELLTIASDVEPWPDCHVAEYLPGDEFSVDVLCEKGEARAVVARLRNDSLFGLATDAEVVEDEVVRRAAVEIVAAVGLDYVVNVQLKRDADGLPRLMEINPRVPGTIGLTVASGVNMPYLAIKMALDEPFEAPAPCSGKRILRTWGGVFVGG